MAENENDQIIGIKVILLGESGVGKTSLINVTSGGEFKDQITLTTSSYYVKKDYTINSQKYQINLWDTAGEERYKYLTKLFYKGSDIVVFVYDITSRKSFENLNIWIEEVRDIIDSKYICGIVGNKTDLFINEVVKNDEGEEFAKNNNMKFKLVSAKDDPKSFTDFLEELINDSLENLEEKRKNVSLKIDKKKRNGCRC